MAEASGTEAVIQVPKNLTEEESMKEELVVLQKGIDSSLLPAVNDDIMVEEEGTIEISSKASVDLPVITVNTEGISAEMDTDKIDVPNCEDKCKMENAEQGNVTSCIQTDIKRAEPTVAEMETMDSGDVVLNHEKPEAHDARVADQKYSESVGNIPNESHPEIFASSELTTSCVNDGQSNASKLESKELATEKVDEPSHLAVISADTEMKSDQKAEDNPSDKKDDYRKTVEISDSEDSDSSSISSLSSPSSDSDSEDCVVIPETKEKGKYSVIKAPGELLPEDLPPIDELHITVPSSLCAEIGVVTSIVQPLVVIQSCKGVPALDLDSVLFLDRGARALGAVFDVFGPVTEPLYCVRFNSAEHIAEFNVKPGDQVYYAPQTEHSKYVFLQQLMRMRGSDASKRDDLERNVQVEFSDDEEEKKAWKEYGGELNAEDDDPDQLKRKRDNNEVLENKKKFASQFPPRSQRGGHERPRLPTRGRPAYRPHQTRPGQPRQEGPIHPPNFSFPPPPLPGPSGQRPNAPGPQDTYSNYHRPQGPYNNQPYQNSMPPNPSFGQLPYNQPQASPQVDPRVFQFGAQFAQMVCNLQNSSPSMPMNVPPPAPSFSAPYNNQPMYSGNQNNYNSFYPPSQNQPSFSSPQFNSPPVNMPPPSTPPYSQQRNTAPPVNMPPPSTPPYSQQRNTAPNQNPNYGEPYGSPYPRYNNRS